MKNYLVRYGITDLNEKITRENTVQWANFEINQEYILEDENNDNDIGLVKLRNPINLGNTRARPACLDFGNDYSSYLSLSG